MLLAVAAFVAVGCENDEPANNNGNNGNNTEQGGNEDNENEGNENEGNENEGNENEGGTEEKTPVLTLAAAEVEVAADAVAGEVAYTLENEKEGAEFTFECEAEWLSAFAATEGKVTFTVAANDGDAREAKVTVKYDVATAEFTVKQAAKAAGGEDATDEWAFTWKFAGDKITFTGEDGVVIEGHVNSLYGDVCKVGDGTFNATAETFVDPTVVTADYEFYGITVDGTPVTTAEGYIKIATLDIRLDLKLDNVAYKGVGSFKMK